MIPIPWTAICRAVGPFMLFLLEHSRIAELGNIVADINGVRVGPFGGHE